jgi:ribokinase
VGRITVVGGINLDLVTLVDRLPRPGETILGRPGLRGLGGKGANQAVAGLRAGGEVRLVGAVGLDAAGDEMLAALAAHGLATDWIARVARPTGYAQILVGGGDNQIVVVSGANWDIEASALDGLDFRPGDVCVAQLEVSVVGIATAFARARAADALTLLNVAPADAAAVDRLLSLTDIVVANEGEWSIILGAPFDIANPERALLSAAAMPALGDKSLLVATLGGDGVCSVAAGRVIRLPAHTAEVVDTTGAGDCFCGYLAAALAEGAAPLEALSLANAAAALAIGKAGAAASVPSRAEVDRFRSR